MIEATKQERYFCERCGKRLSGGIHTCTPPAKREWVGLTDEEQQEIYEKHSMDGWGLFYEAIETKLRQKNT